MSSCLLHSDSSSFLQCELDLKDMFGGYEYPQPPDDSLTNLAAELMELDNGVVIQTEPNFEGMSREDVDQGPLVKVWKNVYIKSLV